MKALIETYKNNGNLHHAYLIEGDKDSLLPELLRFIEKDMKIEIHGNPDFSIDTFDTFTIEDGRSIQERQSRRSFTDKKIYIIHFRFITVEAQNALLKVFEEPTEGTHFFIVTPTAQILLPTLRSRLNIISDTIEKKEATSTAEKFMKASMGERLGMIKEIIEEKDKSKAIDFVSDLERVISEKKIALKNGQGVEEVLTAKKYLHDRSPSIKLLLEHLALIL
jgi:hypothetical protein